MIIKIGIDAVTFLYRLEGEPEVMSLGEKILSSSVVSFFTDLLGIQTAADNLHPFTDVESGAYYEEAVIWAYENGITNGMTATTFGPNNNCTRAHAVTLLYRAFN